MIEKIKNRIIFFAPFLIRYLLKLKETDNVLIAATDGSTIMIGPMFKELSEEVQSFAIFHEIYHVLFRHTYFIGEPDLDVRLANIAMDKSVNSCLLDRSGEFKYWIANYSDLFKVFVFPEEGEEWGRDWLYYYQNLLDNQKMSSKYQDGEGDSNSDDGKDGDDDGKENDSDGNGNGGSQCNKRKIKRVAKEGKGGRVGNTDDVADKVRKGMANDVLKEDKATTVVENEETKRIIREQRDKQGGIGNLPGWMDQLVEKLEKKIDWKKVLKNFISYHATLKGAGDYEGSLNFREIKKRKAVGVKTIIRKLQKPVFRVKVVADCSGSVWSMMSEILSCVVGLESEELEIVLWDTREVGRFKGLPNKKEIKIEGGGGGTDMKAALETIAKEREDVIVCVTDGFSAFPDAKTFRKLGRTIIVVIDNKEFKLDGGWKILKVESEKK